MSRVPEEWGRDQWVMGNREAFKELAASVALPRWLRVTYAAYGHVGANGHAVFRQLELAALLGDDVTGHLPAERQRVREAIDRAIDRELLEPGSKALCLIVPRGLIAFGQGDKEAPCRRHPIYKRNAESVSPGVETTRFSQVVSPPKERGNRVVSGVAPLSLLVTQPNTHQRPAS